jgi:hypothetical protein
LRDGVEYREGTIGTYRGGTWQAWRDVKDTPIKDGGWRLLADGVAEVRFSYSEEGDSGTLEVEFANATVKQWPIVLSPVRHLGAWDKEHQYSLNDEIAWNGSTWRALRFTVGVEPPGEDWRLVAQRGKTGPRGELGPMGSPGPVGPPGVGVDKIELEDRGLVVTLSDGTVQAIPLGGDKEES